MINLTNCTKCFEIHRTVILCPKHRRWMKKYAKRIQKAKNKCKGCK